MGGITAGQNRVGCLMDQIEMFETLPPDETAICTKCGKEIVTQHFTEGMVSSEFVSEKGECFRCSRK